MSNENTFVRLVSDHKVLSGVLIVLAVLLIAYFGLVTASLRYDRSDPRARPNSYHSIETVVVDRSIDEIDPDRSSGNEESVHQGPHGSHRVSRRDT